MKGPDIPIQDFLQNLPLFSDLTPEEIDRIASGTRRVYCEKGETIFLRGDACEGFHVVLYGQVKLSVVSPQGAEKVIEILGPGMSFGEAVLFLEMPYPVGARALADSLLLHVSKPAVFAEIEHDPRFARRMLAGLSRRLHGLVRDVEAYSLASATERVIGYLLGDTSGEPCLPGAKAVVELPVNKAVIASRLNLTPEYFSRILHDLEHQGLVAISGRAVTVPDLERLRAYKAS